MLGCQQGSLHLSAFFLQTTPERKHLDKSRGWQHPIHHENCHEGSQCMEVDHMHPMAALIYDTEGANKVIVKDVKEMLNSAAKALAPLQQYLQEAKALVQKLK